MKSEAIVKKRVFEAILGLSLIYIFSGQLIITGYSIIALYLFLNSQLPAILMLSIYNFFHSSKKSIKKAELDKYPIKIKKYEALNPALLPLILFLPWSYLTIHFWKLETPEIPDFMGVYSLFFISLTIFTMETNEKVSLDKDIIFLGMIAIFSVMIFEYLSGYQLTILIRNALHLSSEVKQPLDKASTLITIILPILYGVLNRKHKLFPLLILLITATYAFVPMRATQTAFAVSIIVIILHHYFGKHIIKLFFAGSIIFLLISPIIFGSLPKPEKIKENIPDFPESWMQRIDMWHDAVKLIEQKPVMGWGFNTSRYLNDVYKYFGLRYKDFTDISFQIHPHNQFLQLWLETGFIGIALIAIMLALIYRTIASIRSEYHKRYIIASLAACLVYMLVSFSAWQEWWLSSLLTVILAIRIFVNIEPSGSTESARSTETEIKKTKAGS